MSDDDHVDVDLAAAEAARAYAGAIGDALLSRMPPEQKAGVMADVQIILTTINNLNKADKSNAQVYAAMMVVCESIFQDFHDSMRDHTHPPV